MTDHRSTKLERVLEVAELCHGTCYFLADLRAAERELQTCSATLEQEDGDADLKIVLPLTAHGAEIEAWEFELHSIETASVDQYVPTQQLSTACGEPQLHQNLAVASSVTLLFCILLAFMLVVMSVNS